MKKAFSFLVGVLSLVFILYGCSNTSTQPEEETAQPSEPVNNTGGIRIKYDQTKIPGYLARVEAILVSQISGDTLTAEMYLTSVDTAQYTFTDLAEGNWYLTLNDYKSTGELHISSWQLFKVFAGTLSEVSTILGPYKADTRKVLIRNYLADGDGGLLKLNNPAAEIRPKLEAPGRLPQ